MGDGCVVDGQWMCDGWMGCVHGWDGWMDGMVDDGVMDGMDGWDV